MKKQNILFESIKDLSDKQILSGVLTLFGIIVAFTFFAGGWFNNQENVNENVKKLLINQEAQDSTISSLVGNVKEMADALKDKGLIPVNCAFKTDTVPKEIYLADNKIYRKKSKRRIAQNETALDDKDFENIITE